MSYNRYSIAKLICLIIILTTACSSNDINYTPPSGSTETAINHYSFGKIIIDGKTYESDVVILPGGQVNRWSFELSTHEISSDNIKGFILDNVKTIIIGTGYNAEAKLSASALDLIKTLKMKDIVVHVMQSSEAVQKYNSISKNGLIAFFHLSC